MNRYAAIVTIACFLLTVFTIFKTKDSLDKHLYSIWHAKYNYNISHGEMFIDGSTEYLKNNKYNFIGQIKIYVYYENIPLYVTFNVDATGSWMTTSDSLIITMNDFSSWPHKATYKNNEIPIKLAEKFMAKPFPTLEDYLPSGISEEFHIQEMSNSKIKVSTQDPTGKLLSFSMIKE